MIPHEPAAAGTEHLGELDRRRLDEAAHQLARARGTGDPVLVIAAAGSLEDLLDELGLAESALRLRAEVRHLHDAVRRSALQLRLAPDLGADDAAVRALAEWTLGLELHRTFDDRPAAAAAYLRAITTDRATWITVAAAMNLAQILEDDGDLDGARAAYELVVRVGPTLEDSRLVEARVHDVAAGRLARLPAPDDGTDR